MAMGPQLVADVLTDFDDLATSGRHTERRRRSSRSSGRSSATCGRRPGGSGTSSPPRPRPRRRPHRHRPLPTMVGEKPPRTFPEWTDLVARYNAVQLGGEPRGWEHTKSKLYTPLGLGEILASRTWSSLGVVNPLAGRRSTAGAQNIKFVDGGLAVEENQPFVPRGIWAVVDGLDAIRWAWVLTGVGTEAGVIRYVDWWTTKARLHSSKLEAVVAYWDATAHQLAMSMRLARTFEEVTSAIMADQAAFNEALQSAVKPGPPKRPTGGPPNHPTEDDHTADTPKGKGKGRGRQPRRRPGKQRRQEQDWEDDGANRDWGRDHHDDRRQPQNRWKQTGRDEGRDQGWRQSWGRGRQDQWDQDDRRGGKDRRDEGRREVPGSQCASTVVRPALKRTRRAPKIILLSFFDGIGAAPALVENLFGQPTLALAWEIDATCRRLASVRLPWLVHRGDVTSESPGSVVAAVRKADPTGECTVVVTGSGGQDFSRIGPATGHAGERGSLFLLTVDMFNQIIADLSDRRVAFLFENVVMEPADAAKISDALGVQPVLVCGSDFGWISRPRLWWMSADLTGALVDPASGRPLQWSKQGSYRRLRLEAPRQPADELTEAGLSFHQSVESGRLRLPCSTTPAEDAGFVSFGVSIPRAWPAGSSNDLFVAKLCVFRGIHPPGLAGAYPRAVVATSSWRSFVSFGVSIPRTWRVPTRVLL
ncbi:unnamed protein product [Symbiodinium sp. CCMP2592]|nr:unnamed protein product [Symbiodinium sp. CCMP2592]